VFSSFDWIYGDFGCPAEAPGPYIQDAIGCPDEAVAIGQVGSPEVTVLLSLGFSSIARYRLTVSDVGQGTVTSTDGQIDCINGDGVCSAIYASGTTVTLNAAAAGGSTFSEWNGSCSGGDTSCSLVMNGNSTATATFLASQTITFGTLGNVVFGAASFTVNASSSAGLAVTFTSTQASVCTVSGTTITIIAAGICSITASQVGNSTVAPATPLASNGARSPLFE
jgi:hypothetical protein